MNIIRRGICLLLSVIFALCVTASAFAMDESLENATGILDEQELTKRVEAILTQYGIDGQQIAVGYYYSGSGDTYLYHGDSWMYSASLFKVPLYMALDDDIAAGRIRPSGAGLTAETVDSLRDRVLINSVTSTAKQLMGHFGSYEECREEYRRYSSLPEDYYPDSFWKNSNFSSRFMTDVMAWLLDHRDSYPKIFDSLYRSPLRQDLASLGETYTIAQKYGDYDDQYVAVHHMAAIIDTPTPIAVVVMTSNVAKHRLMMNAIATMLAEYSIELDQQTAAAK